MFHDDLPFRHYGAKLAGDAIELRRGWAPPRIQTRTPDGSMVIEIKPSAPCLKMLHPSGTVYELVAGPGAGRRMPDDPQESRILSDKVKLGHLPYGRCPKSLGLHRHLPDGLQNGPPCTVSASGKPIGPDTPCACVVEVERMRKARQNALTAELEDKYKQNPQKALELAERRADAADQSAAMMANALEKLAAIVDKQGKK